MLAASFELLQQIAPLTTVAPQPEHIQERTDDCSSLVVVKLWGLVGRPGANLQPGRI